MSSIHRIVLTGGPCGGKSTALDRISKRIGTCGVDIYRVPEAATIVLGGGVSFRGMTPPQVAVFQSSLLHAILALEDSFYAIAHSTGRPSVLLCDRGTMDGAAYVSEETWSAILNDRRESIERLRDLRYDAVIHLVTAADGAERHYTTANNAVRTESPEKARQLDARVRDAWAGHPKLHVIDNSTDFDGKIDRVVKVVCAVIGLPLSE